MSEKSLIEKSVIEKSLVANGNNYRIKRLLKGLKKARRLPLLI